MKKGITIHSRSKYRQPGLRSRTAGFSLLETMVAMGLLTFVLIGAFALLVGSWGTMRRTQESLYVTRLLETTIEMTRNLSFTDIAGDPTAGIAGYAASSPISFTTAYTLPLGTNNEILYSKGVIDSTDPKAEMTLEGSSGRVHFSKVNDDLYKVTATVTYTPFRRPQRTQSVTTYIARNGINRR